MILIYPPVAKLCEPPAGIARLAGVLSRRGIPCRLLDANVEGLLYLLQQPRVAADTWTRRAIRNLSSNIAALRDVKTYRSFDRYVRAVRDVQRVLAVSCGDSGAVLKLGDYRHQHLSPLRSADWIRAAEQPERNPFYPFFSKRLRLLLEQEQPNIVGFSLNYLSQALCTFSMIGYVRKEFPGLKVILGGGLAGSWIGSPGWTNPFGGLVDELIAGPGEHRLLELSGIPEMKDGNGAPDYGLLPLPDYLSPGFILPYSAASGCYWSKCSFCPETAENNPYRPVAAGRVIADLHELVMKKRPVLLHLLDNAISPALMGSLTDHPPGVPWYGFARIGRELAGSDFCAALRRSGCVMLQLGLESGDQGVLDVLHKGIEIGMASQVLHNLRKAGIAAYVYLLFGTPAETVREARRTLDFVVEHRDAIDFLNLAIFNMPAGGPEAGEYESGQFYEGDLSLYTAFRHPRGWDRKYVRQFLDREFKRNAAVATILKKDPPAFTSNHAAFFTKGWWNEIDGRKER